MPADIRSTQPDDTKQILMYGLWLCGPEYGPNILTSGVGQLPARGARGTNPYDP